MEQKIETVIDNWLESMANGFYMFSIVLGIFLIILGFVFLIQKKSKKIHNISWICFAVGVLSIISGIIQIL